MSGKRLAVYLGCAVLAYLIGIFVVKPLLPPSSQEVHMKQVKEHIERISPAWTSFKGTNEGFDVVKFRVGTEDDGVMRVDGYLTSRVQVARLFNFLAETHPPRPLSTNYLFVDHESEQIGSATNQSPGAGQR